MSVLGKTWLVQNEDIKSSLLSKLLANRGLDSESEIHDFLYPDAEKDFHDPFLMKGMRRAVSRIGNAIEKSERIMIFGDYDVDGVTGSAILMRTLKNLRGNVSYRLPHRIEDGYGLREKFVEEFKKLDVKLVITVDNGISCAKEVELANKYGIDVIITDHHTVPEKIPPALEILHPKLPNCRYPFPDLTGAGVALKLAQALLITRAKNPEIEIRNLLDLACMGTIADLGELRGENRYIVKEGLKVLENTRWPGLSRLKEYAGVSGKISTHTIGFLLSPRINAAGRISHPSHALRLLLHDSDQTHLLARNLEKLNRQRQQMMEKLLELAEKMALSQTEEPLIILSHKDFHGGIIGLIAGRLSEKYSRPAIIMEQRENVLVGSCRSRPGINIVELLALSKNLLMHFGGHAAAAGFEIAKENLETFSMELKNNLLKSRKILPQQSSLNIDCELSAGDISAKTVEVVKMFEPFGIGNEMPRFLCRQIKIHAVKTMGKDGKHLKLQTEQGRFKMDCIGFGFGKFAPKLKKGSEIDVVCEVEEDAWNGNKKIQLKIVDFDLAGK